MAEKTHSLSLFRQYTTDDRKGIERTRGMGMTCMQRSVCNYNGKSWYLNTVLGTNYKLKLNRTTLFVLILRATPKCYLKDQEKHAKTNTVCKWVVSRCKGHVYPSCYEGPNYSIHYSIFMWQNLAKFLLPFSLLLLLAAPQAPARQIEAQVVCCTPKSLNIRGW